MATARKLPSGSWRCRVYDYTDETGKKIYKSFTSSDTSRNGKYEAENMANMYLQKKDFADRTTNITFKASMSEYVELKEPVLSPATIRGYKNIEKMLNNKFSDFTNKNIHSIKQKDIQKVINVLAKEKSPKTVRNYHGLISSVMALKCPNKQLNTTMPKKVRADIYIPSDEEIKRLMASVKDTELEIPVLLAAFCTMRRGEICGLSMSDISGNIIHVHHSLVLGSDKEWHLKSPKTVSSDRFIDAPQFVINRIEETGHITNLNPHSITIMFQRVLDRNGINHFRFHDLRHYSASIQHALGIPDAYIMQRGGWSSDKVLKAVYRHAMSDRQKEMNQIANDHFSKLYDTKYDTK